MIRTLTVIWRALITFLRMLGIRLVTDDFRRTNKPKALIDGLIATGCMRRGDNPSAVIQSQGGVSLHRRMIYVAYILRHENPEKLSIEIMVPVAAAAPVRPLAFPENHQWGPPWKWHAFINAVLHEAQVQWRSRPEDDQFWPSLKA